MLEFLIKTTLLLALGLGASLCIPRAYPALRHTVLLAALLALPLVPLTRLIPRAASVRISLPSDRATLVSDSPSLSRGSSGALWGWLRGLWGTIALCLLVRRLTDSLALRRLLATTTPSSLAAPFPVLLMAKPTSPLACGILRRRILLP